ncbi:MAG: carboxypeptidase regulatory-like domain-containing protein [Candidatus Sumerlaeaceae bacterium]
MPDVQPGNPLDPKHRLPWIVAAGAIVFALVVLIRSELSPENPAVVPATVATEVSSTPLVRPIQQPVRGTISTAPATGSPTPAPVTPTPSPSPSPVTYSLSGTITDSNGKPLPNATVRTTYRIGGSQISVDATSDASGTFTLSGIRSPDLDVVVVEAVGYGRSVVERLELPLPDRLEIALSALAGLEVLVQQATDNAQAVEPYAGEADFLLLHQRTASATTSTLGLSEAAVQGAMFMPVAQQHVTIDKGSLRVEELEPGTYKAAVRSKTSYAESMPFTIEGARRTQTTITLGLKYTFGGNVASEAEHRPLPQAGVHLALASDHSLASTQPPHNGSTDVTGRFSLEGVVPGAYRLTLGAAGFTTRTIEGVGVSAAGPPPETTYTLSQQQPYIHVAVMDDDGRPVPQARLVLMMTSPVNKTMFSKTDDAGVKLFDEISPGTYTVAVTAPGERARQKSVDLRIEDGQTTDVQIKFPKTTHVQGHARKDGKPYRGLLVFTLRGSIGLQTIVKTDDTGGYVADLEPGEYMAGSPNQSNPQIVVIGQVQPGNVDVEVK